MCLKAIGLGANLLTILVGSKVRVILVGVWGGGDDYTIRKKIFTLTQIHFNLYNLNLAATKVRVISKSYVVLT